MAREYKIIRLRWADADSMSEKLTRLLKPDPNGKEDWRGDWKFEGQSSDKDELIITVSRDLPWGE